MRGADSGKGGSVPNDLSKTLAHHDAAIANLSGRMTGVENSLTSLGADVNKGFSELSNKLATMDAAKPPSLFIQLRMITAGVTIFAGAATGIGFLVHSYMSPKIVEISGKTDSTSKDLERRQGDDISELKRYRQEDREQVKATLAEHQKQINDLRRSFWVGSTSTASTVSKKGTP